MRLTGKPHTLSLALLVGTTATILAQAPKADEKPAPAAPPIKLVITSLKPDAAIELGGERRFAVASDGVWVTDRTAGTVTRIDPKTNAPDKPLPIGKEPCQSLVFAFRSLWSPLCGANALARLDPPAPPASPGTPKTDAKPGDQSAAKPAEKPADNAAAKPREPLTTIKTAIRGAGPLATATGSIWMITDASGALARIDPDTNAVVAEVTIAAGASALAVSGDSIWVLSTVKATVTRVNGYSNVIEETIKVGPAPVAIAAGEGGVWTLNGGDGSVSRIDPKTNKVAETIKAGIVATSGSIAAGEGSVWISVPGTPLARIDPRTNHLAQQFTGPGGGLVAVGLKSLWVTVTPTTIWRIDPKRVEATIR